jgi:hypothetical protein
MTHHCGRAAGRTSKPAAAEASGGTYSYLANYASAENSTELTMQNIMLSLAALAALTFTVSFAAPALAEKTVIIKHHHHYWRHHDRTVIIHHDHD